MMNVINSLRERYLGPIDENPELFIGVELEFPIVNLKGEPTDVELAKSLMEYLCDSLAFLVQTKDSQGRPIQIIHQETGDQIMFEFSYNTLEIAFAKVRTIIEVERRFHHYLAIIQDFLKQHNHELQGRGVNPNWKINDNRAVKSPRYQMLQNFLERSQFKEDTFFHNYPAYGAFICGNQVQIDVSQGNYLKIINLFNAIEPVKAYLFPNSTFDGENWDTKISRDILWEHSMHGIYEENIGIYKKWFQTDDDYLVYLAQSVMFSVEREGGIYYFDPIQVADYFEKEELQAYGIDGRKIKLIPEKSDLNYHRSYYYQNLTTRGTIEFRSICTQTFENTFVPIAFHLGLIVNLDALEDALKESFLYPKNNIIPHSLRQNYSVKKLPEKQEKQIKTFSQEVLKIAEKGLKKRGKGEERYLAALSE